MIARASRSIARGFTLVELTVVLIIVGVLAVVVVAKLTDVNSFEVQGFFDSTKATVRFAQKLAVAQRTKVVVVVTANTVSVCYTNPGCASPAIDLATGQAMLLTAPAGVSLTGPASVSFDGLGRASPGGTISVNAGGIARTLVIEQDTGYVHE
ncbi:MAG: prepilin-type N-terminal cleavage/methylation domain-containing protein [Burkholderiales bacterium]|nr:prepilin-type N-terminal cleavage/methylation domain-containing protein [Burkholderiales bacterium]